MRSLMGQFRQPCKSSAEAKGPDCCPWKSPVSKSVRIHCHGLIVISTCAQLTSGRLLPVSVIAKSLVAKGKETVQRLNPPTQM